MSAAHLHVALNHFPSIGAIVGFLLLLLARLIKNEGVELSGLAVLVLAAALTIPTYFSGGEAEEIVEDQPGVTEQIIHEHEEAGEFGLIGGLVVGAVALFALWKRKQTGKVPANLSLAVLVLSLAMAGIMVRVGLLGGHINHPELRSDFVAAEGGGDDEGAAEGGESGESEDASESGESDG
ncbi:MAG: hypothetical protein KDH92_09925 [Chloroflexi bacterium]|nr:hypothetical protein [Chloroflexota bacterium]